MITLYYILDPMCSWCYAFSPIWKELFENLDKNIHIRYIYGGLAPHSDEPMPKEMQEILRNTWKNIQNRVGTQFNFDFWTTCKPRRSTYLACQACVVARRYGKEYEMIQAIQYEYYQNASNPSNKDTLIKAAKNIELDIEKFSVDLESKKIIDLLQDDLKIRRELGVNGFPSLLLQVNNTFHSIAIDFKDYKKILKHISSYIN